jgi:hypothetical protein
VFTLVGFTASNAAAAANADTPGITDGWASLQNNHFILPQDLKLIAGYANGAALTDARINTPHFRAVGFPHLWPVDVAALPTSLPAIYDPDPPYLTVPKLDEVAMELSNSAGAPEREFALLWLHDGNFSVPQNDVYSLKFTATITATANVWTPGNLSFESTLPAGTYAVIGGDCFGTTLVAWRLRFQMFTMQPGALGRATQATKPFRKFRMGRLGEWGRFTNTAQPGLQVLCTAADVAQTGILDLVKVA